MAAQRFIKIGFSSDEHDRHPRAAAVREHLKALALRCAPFARRVLGIDDLAARQSALDQRVDALAAVGQIEQNRLRLEYERLQATGQPLPSFDVVEFRAYSENGEDGILHYQFALVGIPSMRGPSPTACPRSRIGHGSTCTMSLERLPGVTTLGVMRPRSR